MSDLVTITAIKRESTGKGYARKLRAKGMIPGNLIGKGQSISIELDPKWLPRAWSTGKKFTMDLDGKQSPVVIHELQYHPVKRFVQHVDLMYA